MDDPVACEVCGAPIRADAEVCHECGALQGLERKAEPPRPPEQPPPPLFPAASPARRNPLAGLRFDLGVDWVLVVLVCLSTAVLALGFLMGYFFPFLLALDLILVALVATNTWGVRGRIPPFNSDNRFGVAGGWFGFAVVGVLAAAFCLPTGFSLPTVQAIAPATTPGRAQASTTPGATAPTGTTATTTAPGANLTALQAEIERDRRATATARAKQSEGTYVVGNTNGDGVAIRRTPSNESRITAWQDGTAMQIVGPDAQAEGRAWKNVKDPAGNVGWVPAEYLVRRAPPATPTSGATGTQVALEDVTALTERLNREMGTRFFEGVQIRSSGGALAVTVSDFWYELPSYVKERTVEMLADNYAGIAAQRGLRAAPTDANYPRTTFYDVFGKELAYKSATEIKVLR